MSKFFDIETIDNNFEGTVEKTDTKLVIQYQQRNGRQKWTNIYGVQLSGDEIKKFVKSLSKKFACSATIKKDDKSQEFIQLQGDHSADLKTFLAEHFKIEAKSIVMKGC